MRSRPIVPFFFTFLDFSTPFREQVGLGLARSDRRVLGVGVGVGRYRQLADAVGGGWLWAPVGDELLDLALALPFRGEDQLKVVRLVQVRCQQADPGQVQAPGREAFQQHRETTGRPGRGDTLVYGIFGQAQLRDAPGEQRGACSGRVELAVLHLGEVEEQLRGGFVSLADQSTDAGEQVFVGQAGSLGDHGKALVEW